jgi:uncharacterized membrane protein YphA (DoxX/SURF4 family)
MPDISTQNVTVARWLLRIGLAGVLLYAASGMTLQPSHWVGFLPAMVTAVVPAATALKLVAFTQLVAAVWLLSGWKGRYAAGLLALLLAGIIVSNLASFEVVFRDAGLMLASVALAVLS